jgi:hypothetical protein
MLKDNKWLNKDISWFAYMVQKPWLRNNNMQPWPWYSVKFWILYKLWGRLKILLINFIFQQILLHLPAAFAVFILTDPVCCNSPPHPLDLTVCSNQLGLLQIKTCFLTMFRPFSNQLDGELQRTIWRVTAHNMKGNSAQYEELQRTIYRVTAHNMKSYSTLNEELICMSIKVFLK